MRRCEKLCRADISIGTRTEFVNEKEKLVRLCSWFGNCGKLVSIWPIFLAEKITRAYCLDYKRVKVHFWSQQVSVRLLPILGQWNVVGVEMGRKGRKEGYEFPTQ